MTTWKRDDGFLEKSGKVEMKKSRLLQKIFKQYNHRPYDCLNVSIPVSGLNPLVADDSITKAGNLQKQVWWGIIIRSVLDLLSLSSCEIIQMKTLNRQSSP